MTAIPAEVAAELTRLRAENARLLRLLKLTPQQAAPPGPAQAARTCRSVSLAWTPRPATPGWAVPERAAKAKAPRLGSLR